jgi:hypothetical protein
MNGSDESAATDRGIDWSLAIRGLLLAWLVPGGGHFLLQRRRRALAFFVIVLLSFLIGISLDGNLYRIMPDRPLSILATLACVGVGTPYLGMRFIAGYSGDPLAPGFEYGSAFILTAGLMNILLILDVWDIARGQKE